MNYVELVQMILMGVFATVIIVPLAVFSLFCTLRRGLKNIFVDEKEMKKAVLAVLHNPQAFSHLLGLTILGICTMLGFVYSR